MQNRYRNLFPATLVFSGGLMLLGFVLESPTDILWGLYHIVTMQDLLITDYVVIGGPGAALINAGLVTAISICIIKISGDPFNGFTIVEMGLMAGFSLFGKNFLNIWPIIWAPGSTPSTSGSPSPSTPPSPCWPPPWPRCPSFPPERWAISPPP